MEEKTVEIVESRSLSIFKIWINVFKWLLGTAAVVWVTMIIDEGFRERSAGIQEMQAFDNYVEIILKADNIEERWKLAEFFSTVTPTSRLREKWISYKNTINVDYNKFKNLKEQEYTLNEEVREGKSPEAINKLNEVRKQLEPFETKLAEPVNLKSTTNSVLEGKLKSFREKFEQQVPASTRLKLDDIFNNATRTDKKVLDDLINDLGSQYAPLLLLPTINYRDGTFLSEPGIVSKGDYTKKIQAYLNIKVAPNEVIFKISEEKGTTDSLKFPINSIKWGQVAEFERRFFLMRLDQIK